MTDASRYRGEDDLQQRVDQVHDYEGLLSLPVGVPLVGQLQVILHEAVGQGRAVHTPIHDSTFEHLPSVRILCSTCGCPRRLIGRSCCRLFIPRPWKQQS